MTRIFVIGSLESLAILYPIFKNPKCALTEFAILAFGAISAAFQVRGQLLLIESELEDYVLRTLQWYSHFPFVYRLLGLSDACVCVCDLFYV